MSNDLIVDLIVVLIGAFLGATPIYFLAKKFIKDLAMALEDDVISKEELILLIQDSFGIINILKNIKR